MARHRAGQWGRATAESPPVAWEAMAAHRRTSARAGRVRPSARCPVQLAGVPPSRHSGERRSRSRGEVPMRRALLVLLVALALLPVSAPAEIVRQSYTLPDNGGYPHDVAIGADGIAWYTAQRVGALGRLD